MILLVKMLQNRYEGVQIIMLIGDRLYTDIACGKNAGIDTIFVLSGEGTLEDIPAMGITPTRITPEVKELLPEF